MSDNHRPQPIGIRPGSAFGFGLLEPMVTLLVVSFGLLALAYMETWAMRFGHESESRTQATIIATDFVERLRAVDAAPEDDAVAAVLESVPMDSAACSADGGSLADDRDCFFAQLAERLPGAAASVGTLESTVPPVFEVTVAWPERRLRQRSGGDASPGIVECRLRGKLASQNPGTRLHWASPETRPAGNTCLEYARWWIRP